MKPRVSLLLVVPFVCYGLFVPAARVSADPGPATEYAQAVFDATNAARLEHGLPPLNPDPRLAQAALLWARSMAEAGTLAHELPGQPGVGQRLLAQGYRFSEFAENLAAVPIGAQELVDAFMADPYHRENILNSRLRHMGVGVWEVPVPAGPPMMWVVQDLGRPLQQRTPPVEIEVRPKSLDFGVVVVGQEAALTLTVQNVSKTGASNLQGRVSLPEGKPFAFAPGADGTFNLARGQSKEFRILFKPENPANLGVIGELAQVQSNATRPASQPVIARLEGVGVLPGELPRIHVSPNPDRMNFGNVPINAGPTQLIAWKQRIVTNVGGGVLTFRIKLEGKPPFRAVNDLRADPVPFPAALVSLRRGESKEIWLGAFPKEEREFTGKLTFLSNDAMQQEIPIDLRVMGGAPLPPRR